MALALTADRRVEVEVHHDERAAAFMALGVGMATGVPAVVLTTSGTAAVELHPAVVEAHHGGVPMLVCTADRPPWLQGVGAPQTIDQRNLYGTAVRAYFEPGVPDPGATGSWRQLAADAWVASVGPVAGPVQLNLAFDEPLLGTPGTLPADPPAVLRVGGGLPVEPGADAATRFADTAVGRRGVVVAGGGIGDPDGVLALASALGWPVLADPRSGCRVPDPLTVAHADGILRHGGAAGTLGPEVVLRLGALPASKVVGQWLDGLDALQVGVTSGGVRIDPGGSLNEVVDAEPGAWCRLVVTGLGVQRADTASDGASWSGWWRSADDAVASAYATVVASESALTEPQVARIVSDAAPAGSHVVVSSSMPVRDLEWYAPPRRGVTVLANRGANGIDGVVSTAVGVGVASGKPVTVLVGDVAMLHDTNALLGLARRPVTLTVVVVDNDGGGIFSFLPQATGVDHVRFEQLFGTPHGVDVVALAEAHGVDAIVVDSSQALAEAVAGAPARGGAQVVVVTSDRQTNVGTHQRLHDAAHRALDALPWVVPPSPAP